LLHFQGLDIFGAFFEEGTLVQDYPGVMPFDCPVSE